MPAYISKGEPAFDGRDCTSSGGFGMRFLASQTAVFILFGPYLALLLDENNRYDVLWERKDTLFLLLLILMIGFAYVGVGELLRRFKNNRLTRIYDHIFVIALAAGLLANIRFYLPPPGDWVLRPGGVLMSSVWLIVFALVGFSIARPQMKTVLRCRQFCQIVTPVFAIVVFQLLMGTVYPSPSDPIPAENTVSPSALTGEFESSGNSCGKPVYLFILDCWSYERTFDESGQVRPSMPNLASIASQATCFTNAESAGGGTTMSIPRLLYQLGDSYTPSRESGKVGFEKSGVFLPNDSFDTTIFSAVEDMNYRKVLVGFGIPYGAWIGNRLDICRSYRFADYQFGNSESVSEQLMGHFLRTMVYWTDPWSGFLQPKIAGRAREFPDFYKSVREDIFWILENQPAKTFGLFHCPWPHPPYLVNADGSFRKECDAVWDGGDLEGYELAQAYADRLLGEFVGVMKRKKRYDDALIIVTSDHTWWLNPKRKSGELTTSERHVPLVIKFPHQRNRLTVTDKLVSWDLSEVIRYGLISGENWDNQNRVSSELAFVVEKSKRLTADRISDGVLQDQEGVVSRTAGNSN